MKINIFSIVFIFSVLVSLSIQIQENQYYGKFLSKNNDQDVQLTLQSEEEEDQSKETDSTQEEETYEIPEDETEESQEEQKEQEEEKEEKEKEEKEKKDIPNTDQTPNTEEKDKVNIKCLYVSKYNVYTLQKLTKDNGYTQQLSNGKFQFNFCKNLDGVNSTAVFHKNISGENISQILFSGSIEGSNTKNEWSEITEDNGAKGLRIKLAEGSQCDSERKHQTIFKIYCNDTIPDDQFQNYLNFTEFNEFGCVHYIKGYSIYGCALNDWYLLRKLMKEYNYIFATVFIIVGLFLVLWGKKCELPTLMIVIGILVCYLATIIILNFIPSLIKTERNLFILLGVGFLVGALIGLFLKGKIRVLAVIVGGAAGYSVTEFVYTIVSGFITADPTILYWVVFGICIIIGGILGYCIVEAIVIIGTSILGGYVVMRGVTLIFDNYMELAEFTDLAKNGEWEELKNIRSGWVYAYIGLWLILSVFGVFYQCYLHKKKKGNSNNDGKDYKKI